MSLDLTGISNDNEFYSHHYLSAILEGDIRDVLKEWVRRKKEEDLDPPYAALRRLARPFFAVRARLEGATDLLRRLDLQHEVFAELLPALGYPFSPDVRRLDGGDPLPIVGEVAQANGRPLLWLVEAVDTEGEGADPLELSIVAEQLPEDEETDSLTELTFAEVLTKKVFFSAEPPRWVIVLSDAQVVLVDRSKWNERRVLRFDLSEILGRKQDSTLRAMAALLHRESTCPEEGLALLDTLDESSHKHAFAVSEDLKYALREAIELLGNEAVYYLREVRKEGIYGRQLAEQLTEECLRYMYRLLFLFYIEARPELGYAPIKSDEYRDGYSLESLRGLEMVQLTTDEARSGHFIHDSLSLLFRLIYEGYPPESGGNGQQLHLEGQALEDEEGAFHTFRIAPLQSHLFDPERTPLLGKVRFRNEVLQKVIHLMSLSRPGGRSKRRGRISYAQLGINQLGAVYEGLLSYRGFFAEEDLYEVKKKGDAYDELKQAFFVKAADLEKYEDEEKVFDADGALKKHPKGSFIYRLAGRDREKSASYYTPEVLTKCLVKYALKELLQDKTADDILELTVCEPAMGSAAFLNEAINQLSEAYLDLKQKELGDILAPDDYAYEKQKVKMYLADNNVFGVDLNPVAVELAEVSLWLNTIHRGGFVPWFGMQLVCGNSLVGARRQVFDSQLLRKRKKGEETWMDAVPERIPLGEERPGNSVYHFLVPDKGMAAYNDKVVKQLVPEKIKTIKDWSKDFCRPFSASEIETLERLSGAIDRLWAKHIEELERIRARTTDPITVFGQDSEDENAERHTSTRWKDRVLHQELYSEAVRNSSPYRRLKLAMDYWCALWFWPIEQADLLPTREEYLLELQLLLEGNVFETVTAGEQVQLFPDTMPQQLAIELKDEFGLVDLNALCEKRPRLALVEQLTHRYRYLHWELEFADTFHDRGGFDLVLGNPPWIQISWNEGGLMGDHEPLFAIRGYSSSKLAGLREETLTKLDLLAHYLAEFEEADASQIYLNSSQNYSQLGGMKANSYKCFLVQAWQVASKRGITGYLHPEGVCDDPNGGQLRREIYPRLRQHFQFQNEFGLFTGTNDHGRMRFGLNIYGPTREVGFSHICNLYWPPTVDACFASDDGGSVPGIKDDDHNWNTAGHRDRIVEVTEDNLALFASLYDDEGTPPLEARLPSVHSRQVVEVLRKFAAQPRKLGDLGDIMFSTQHWNETNAQKDGTIRRETRFVESPTEWVMSGPHFFVANPLNKTPRRVSRYSSHYDSVDLTAIPDDYLPRTNYIPACDPAEYRRRTPRVPWGEKKPVTEFYRIVSRTMISPPLERTLISAVIPPHVGHIDLGFSICPYNQQLVPRIAGLFSSIPYDFFIKTTGKSHFRNDLASILPFREQSNRAMHMLETRSLMLNCLTQSYDRLWRACWTVERRADGWSSQDHRLTHDAYSELTGLWTWHLPIRTDFGRRQALVEIDVLAAVALGLTLEELQAIYRVQFPVLRMYEQDTWYDQNGRIVFTNSRGLTGVGFTRPKWNEIKDMKSGTIEQTITDDTMPDGPVERTILYEAPFDRCDREEDYAIAWAEFESRF